MMDRFHKRARKLTYLFLIAVIVIAYLILSRSDFIKTYFASPYLLQEKILSWGILAPLVIVFLQAFQSTISLFPSQITTVAAGFIFGTLLGTIYSLTGAFIGSLSVFLLSRKYGEKIALKIFEKKEISHFQAFLKQKKRWALLIARIIPIFPNDLVSMAAGMTTISLRDFNLVSTAGFLVQITILTYIGSGLAERKLSTPLIILIVIVALLSLVALFRKKLKEIIIKDFHKIEKKLEQDTK